MDDVWIYGSDPANIYATIVEGRPNGMPAFGGHIPDNEVWELVAYVRSMSGLAPSGAAPNRDDALHVKEPESQADATEARRRGAVGRLGAPMNGVCTTCRCRPARRRRRSSTCGIGCSPICTLVFVAVMVALVARAVARAAGRAGCAARRLVALGARAEGRANGVDRGRRVVGPVAGAARGKRVHRSRDRAAAARRCAAHRAHRPPVVVGGALRRRRSRRGSSRRPTSCTCRSGGRCS